jgi:proline iminopeptidase
LGGQFTFYYYHQRGSGASTRPIDRFTSSNYRENAATLVQALGIAAQLADIERIRKLLGEDRLILVGHSFDGFLAALYAAEFPEHVRKLLLVAPADLLRFPQPDGGLYERVEALLPAESRAAYQDWLRRYFDYGSLFKKSEADLETLNLAFMLFWEQAEQAMHPSSGRTPPVDPALVGGWVQPGAYFSMGQRYDCRASLSRLTVPALVLVGDRDPVGATSVADYRSLPNARIVVIPGSGHFPQEDAPNFPSLAGAFLDE